MSREMRSCRSCRACSTFVSGLVGAPRWCRRLLGKRHKGPEVAPAKLRAARTTKPQAPTIHGLTSAV